MHKCKCKWMKYSQAFVSYVHSLTSSGFLLPAENLPLSLQALAFPEITRNKSLKTASGCKTKIKLNIKYISASFTTFLLLI